MRLVVIGKITAQAKSFEDQMINVQYLLNWMEEKEIS